MTVVESIEGWCRRFILDANLETKLAPGAPPAARDERAWEPSPESAETGRGLVPGRPDSLRSVARSPKTPSSAPALQSERARALLFHTFLHHELQAAELFAWAILAFPETPREFRSGLLRLAEEELLHLSLYREHLTRLGFEVGDFPVRDWFWERVSTCANAASFVALQGLGLEGANLEHSARFARLFREAGDEDGAGILERVGRDEIGHVAFARHWFERLTGEPLEYATWRAALPAPLTPAVLQGRPLNREARRSAGLDDAFLEQLENEPATHVSRRSVS